MPPEARRRWRMSRMPEPVSASRCTISEPEATLEAGAVGDGSLQPVSVKAMDIATAAFALGCRPIRFARLSMSASSILSIDRARRGRRAAEHAGAGHVDDQGGR